MSLVYLDNNATTPVDPEVKKVMDPFFEESFGNPSSLHSVGTGVKEDLDEFRGTVANFFGCNSEGVIFTSGATESANLALRGLADRNLNKRHIVTSLIEHSCVLKTCEALEEKGFEVTYVSPDSEGRTDPLKIVDAVRPDTVLVCLMHINNETGVINDIREVGRLIKEKNPETVFFSDGAQAVGKVSVSLENVDLYSISAHKFHGPKGVGVLVNTGDVDFKTQITGGGQEMGLRSGTENVAGIAGLAKALVMAEENKGQFIEKASRFSTKLRQVLGKMDGVVFNSPEDAVATTLNISFPKIPTSHMVAELDKRGVLVSGGSACLSNKDLTSAVLDGMGLTDEVKKSAVRISFSRFTTEDDIDKLIEVLDSIYYSIY